MYLSGLEDRVGRVVLGLILSELLDDWAIFTSFCFGKFSLLL
jgi:hypothetical protein